MSESRDTVGSSSTRVSFDWLVESFDALSPDGTSSFDLPSYENRSGYRGGAYSPSDDDDRSVESAAKSAAKCAATSAATDTAKKIESRAMQLKFRAKGSKVGAEQENGSASWGKPEADKAALRDGDGLVGGPRAASKRAVALALTPINAIKDAFMRHRESLSRGSKHYTIQQMDILRSICNMVIKICTLYRIDPLSKVLQRHQRFIGDASKFLKASQLEFAKKAEVCSTTEERYYNLVYTYQTVALLPIVDHNTK